MIRKKAKDLKEKRIPLVNSELHMRFVNLMIIGVLLFNSAFAVRECIYDPRGFTFHCSNNMPGIQLMPGEEGNITIMCCFTERRFMDSDAEMPITAKVVFNDTYLKQFPNGTIIKIENDFPASKFITGVDFPNSSKGFESFPVTIHYKLPKTSSLYKPNAIIPSRIDIRVILEGVVPNNAVYPQIRIPADWHDDSNFLFITGSLIIGFIVALTVLIIFKKRKSKIIHKRNSRSKRK